MESSFRTKSQSLPHRARNCSEWPDKLLRVALSGRNPTHALGASPRCASSRIEPSHRSLLRAPSVLVSDRVAPVRLSLTRSPDRSGIRAGETPHTLVAESLDLAIKPISRRSGFEANMQALYRSASLLIVRLIGNGAFSTSRSRCLVDWTRRIPQSRPVSGLYLTFAVSRAGFVTPTMLRFHSMGMMAHDDLVFTPSVSACDHQARRLALSPFHPQLSRRRRSARGARPGCLLRDVAAMGIEVRAIVRPRTSPPTPAGNDTMASR